MHTTSAVPTRAAAAALDDADPLACFRARFTGTDDEGPDRVLYLDGNSLGRMPRDTPAALARVAEQEWAQGLVGSWSGWVEHATRIGDALAAGVLGARPGEVMISDTTSVDLYKLLVAAADARPGRDVLVCCADDFPTDRYVVAGVAAQRGMQVREVPAHIDEGLDTGVLSAALDERVAVLVLSQVAYRSGALVDVAAVTALAREAGALVVWDLSHAAGAVVADLGASGADLAVGCTYKHLNGGPGAPAFLYVRRELQEQLRQPIWGWFGAADQFEMGPVYDPAPGIERFAVGTPPVLAMAAVEVGVALVAEAGIERVQAKGRALTDLLVALADAWLAEHGVALASPRDATRRGAHVSLAHPHAWQLTQALIARGVVPDFRTPDRLRLGPAPLYTRFVDVWDAMERLRDVLATGAHESFPAERTRVT
ncbi:kynureninase [Modestobacter sp. I12A-02628]|uniref:Kynureninase n=1 Tax=Goekera deserti TaxID=2497753 RepID=A0A7K3WE14_9ACTN|nr:kynureninase [Goekera deserti]MPQ97374.1 kynureninase [Goekera deserti]NDI48025.1 kynureninase [Goekera deserti]NEL53773.1 kynureninase [Goekera deserti]